MRAALDDTSRIENNDFIRMREGRKPACNHDCGNVPTCLTDGRNEFALSQSIDSRGRIIQHENRRRPEQRARNRHALTLST